MTINPTLLGLAAAAVLLASCGQPKLTSEELHKKLQEEMIAVEEGGVIEIPAGTYEFTSELSMRDVKNVTIKGAGMDKTIINFGKQTEGAQGFYIKADGVTISDMTIQDLSGDGIKVHQSKDVTMRNIKVEWTGGSSAENGAYALYPVLCDGLLIEKCELYNASDAGIYTGQSRNVILRDNYASMNVQGIAIENCSYTEVYNNTCEGNACGIAFYNLPDLIEKQGTNVRIHHNTIRDNNHDNFGNPGAIVGVLPGGTASFILAGRNIEMDHNTFSNHKTTSTGIVSYQLTERAWEDSLYYPFTTGVYVHDNVYEDQEPMLPDTTKRLGKLMASLFGAESPHIVYDGIFDPELIDMETMSIAPEDMICIKNNNTTFCNFNAPSNFEDMSTELDGFDCEMPHPQTPSIKEES